MSKIKTTGQELKKFWDCEDVSIWPNGSQVDGMYWELNGIEQEDIDIHALKDTDIVTFEGTMLYADERYADLAGVMRKWRKAQNEVTLVVQLPTEHQEAFETFLKGLKGRIVK